MKDSTDISSLRERIAKLEGSKSGFVPIVIAVIAVIVSVGSIIIQAKAHNRAIDMDRQVSWQHRVNGIRKHFNATKQKREENFYSVTTHLYKAAEQDEEIYEKMGETETEHYARRVNRMTWGNLRDEFGDMGLANELSEEIELSVRVINNELLLVQGKKGKITASLKDANDELKSAKEILSGWNRRVAVLEKLIELIPSTDQALSQIQDIVDFKDKAVDVVKKVRGQLKDVKVSYSDADGNKMEADFEDQITKLLNTDDVLRRGDLDSGKIITGISAIVTAETPSLMVTVALLAKDIADYERIHLAFKIDLLEKRIEVMYRAKRLVNVAKDYSLDANSLIPEGITDGETVIETLKRLADTPVGPEAEQEVIDSIAGAIIVVQHYVTLAGPITSQVEDAIREEAYIQHLQSIEISRVNTIEHEDLLDNGIEGLTIYNNRWSTLSNELGMLSFVVAQRLNPLRVEVRQKMDAERKFYKNRTKSYLKFLSTIEYIGMAGKVYDSADAIAKKMRKFPGDITDFAVAEKLITNAKDVINKFDAGSQMQREHRNVSLKTIRDLWSLYQEYSSLERKLVNLSISPKKDKIISIDKLITGTTNHYNDLEKDRKINEKVLSNN